jgi:hypothetical protein
MHIGIYFAGSSLKFAHKGLQLYIQS